MLVFLAVFIHAAAHMAHYSQTESLSLLAFAVVLADECNQALRKADEADSERSLIDYGLYCVVGTELVGAVPEGTHHKRELLGKSRLLEIESFVELLGRHVEHLVEFLEETLDALLLIFDAHQFDGDAHDIDRRKTNVSAPDRGLGTEAVLEHAGAATHSGHFVDVTFRVVGAPVLVLIECGVEVEEVGEESAGGHLAGETVEVVVAVLGQIAHAAFLLPYLDGEDGCGAVAHALVGGYQQFADHAASFGRGVGAIVDGGEHHLVPAARVDGVHVVDESLHRLMHAVYRLVDGVLLEAGIPLEAGKVCLQVVLNLGVIEMGEVLAGEGLEAFHLLYI